MMKLPYMATWSGFSQLVRVCKPTNPRTYQLCNFVRRIHSLLIAGIK